MKAENLLKLTKSEKINNFVPKFWVIETVTELHIEDFANDKLYAVRSSVMWRIVALVPMQDVLLL